MDAAYDCATYGGDCETCLNPDSADNAEGGQCDDVVAGCTDPEADNFNPDATTDDGSCLYDGCPEGYLADCSGDGDCGPGTWVGDGKYIAAQDEKGKLILDNNGKPISYVSI